MSPKTSKSPLDDVEEIRRIDKSSMILYSIEATGHYREAARLAEKIAVNYPKPDNIIVTGLGGSAIGGELLKDYARSQAQVSIEINRDYNLPGYADKRSLVIVVSYSGETEETLSAFLDAQRRHCMVFCISSGGCLLEFAEKLNVPYLRVPAEMPPRAASPYLFVPQLVLFEKMRLVSGVSQDLNESTKLLEETNCENFPENSIKSNPAKTLASGINGTVPVVYGFGIYRGVALRWKQQFNENAKVPAKWEAFPELDHNEIVGWERAGEQVKPFSMVFIRDKAEATEVRSRIENTKALMPKASNKFEVWSKGKGTLAKMLSTILLGDFTSIYLAVLRGVDPTPVQTIVTLKKKLDETGTKERVISELEKL